MGTVYAIVAAVIACIVFIIGVAKKARDYGRSEERNKKAENDAQLRLEFDKIDGGAPDLDAAASRLRDRAKRSGADTKRSTR